VSKVSYKVVNMSGAEVGSVDLEPSVFAGQVNEALVHQVITWQRNAKRQGTHSTLNRAKIEATNKKPYKQKGTGRARRGSDVSPLLVGGAVIFGPQPRSYETRLNKRMRTQALVSALSAKVASSSLVIVDDLKSDGKTQTFAKALKAFGIDKKSALVVTAESDSLLTRSAKNIQKVVPMPVAGVNVYDLVKHKYLVCSKSGVEALQKRVKGE
jgi:large subunit ribosomal protein L4